MGGVEDAEQVVVCGTLDSALARLDTMGESIETCWVIGGSSVYTAALQHYRTDKVEPRIFASTLVILDFPQVLMTRILKEFPCDTFFPPLSPAEWEEEGEAGGRELQEEGGVQWRYEVYKRKQPI